MEKSLFDRLLSLSRRLFRVKQVQLDGIMLSTAPGVVAKQVRRAIYKGNYEAPERLLVREALAPGDKVLEIGAGVGLISLLCARIVGESRVLSFEPNPAAAALIKQNYILNGMTPQLRNEAITKKGGAIEFNVSENIFSSSVYDRGGIQSEKHIVNSECFVDILNSYSPNVLVIDVEGAEVDLLSEGDLPGVEKLILELHPHIVGEARIQELCEHLRAIGFRTSRKIEKSIYLQR